MLKIIGLFILVSMATGGLFIWSSYDKFLERSNILTKCYIYQEHNINKFLKIDGKTYDLSQEMFPWEINQTHQNIALKDCELIQMK